MTYNRTYRNLAAKPPAFRHSVSYGFNLIPTDGNRLIFRKELFVCHDHLLQIYSRNNESNVARGNSDAMWDKCQVPYSVGDKVLYGGVLYVNDISMREKKEVYNTFHPDPYTCDIVLDELFE